MGRTKRPFSSQVYSACYGYYGFSQGPVPAQGRTRTPVDSKSARKIGSETSTDSAGPFEIIAEGVEATPPLNSFPTEPTGTTRFFRVTAAIDQP